MTGKLRQRLASFLAATSAATAMEYAVLAAFIAVLSLAAITSIGTKTNRNINSVTNGLN